ncbi:hypothetical protein [Croceicoccus sp. BE223]|uniref:hypothetical protein n=1 Tax=Croceicoccus sp. BE223 TaxID=2817716 RepID=UPI002855838C|nr:hypothetical protein [Croceicoccus sp. BE223]MDR7103401.1 hypothetical protein [Croceicoccus sp. BE223]
MFDRNSDLSPSGAEQPFASLRAGPAKTLHCGLQALRRGDAALVLTAQRRSERAAMLGELVRLVGPGLHRTVRIEGGETGLNLAARLARESICAIAGLPQKRTAPHVPERARTLLVIDDADMLPASALSLLAEMRDMLTGARVQVLLAGSGNLVVTMCTPRCDELWRRVRLVLSLEEAAPLAGAQIARLEQDIARTQARLEAQRRILSIFADSDPRAAPD